MIISAYEYISITYHFIFSTHLRQPTIVIDHEKELYKFMLQLANERGVFVRRIGGMPDHVHLLCDIPPKLSVSDFIKLLKTETSKFMRVNNHFPGWMGWTEGYAGFSVDASMREIRKEYIMRQKEHHKILSSTEELRIFLREAGLYELADSI